MVREGSSWCERRQEEEAEGTRGALSGVGLQGRPTSKEGCVSGGVQSSGDEGRGEGADGSPYPTTPQKRLAVHALGNRDGDLPGGLSVEDGGRKES